MMAHTPARYGPLLEAAGLRKVHDFHAFVLDREGVIGRDVHWAKLGELSDRIIARHPDLRLVRATSKNLEATLTEVNQFANRIRETVWGFTPITPAELEFLTHRIMRVMVPELVMTMRRGDDMVGYLMGVPDVNQALARTRGSIDIIRLAQMPFLMPKIRRARMFAIGADPKLRAIGILPVLFHAMLEGALAPLRRVRVRLDLGGEPPVAPRRAAHPADGAEEDLARLRGAAAASGANLTFDTQIRRTRDQMSNSQAPLESYNCQWSFDSDICSALSATGGKCRNRTTGVRWPTPRRCRRR